MRVPTLSQLNNITHPSIKFADPYTRLAMWIWELSAERVTPERRDLAKSAAYAIRYHAKDATVRSILDA